ncbi:hypothetical protein MAR_030781, partial [Mya arenaria]
MSQYNTCLLRDRKIRRVPSPRALSPDSGLDSEQLTGKPKSANQIKDSESSSNQLSALKKSDNQSEGSSELSNQNMLDGFSDTATEHYKDFQLDDGTSLGNEKGRQTSKLKLPLIITSKDLE